MGARPPTDRPSWQSVDAIVAAIAVVAPWAMGGRQPPGRLLFVGLCFAAALAWLVGDLRRQGKWRWTPLMGLWLAGVGWLALQLIPLPSAVLAVLAPESRQALPLWQAPTAASVGLESWSRISLAPAETRSGLALLLAYGLLFTVALQRLERWSDIDRLLALLGIAVVAMALLGIMQWLSGTERFLWVYRHPQRTACGMVMGSFSNQNHCAHFLALGVGPLLYWRWRAQALGSTGPLKGWSDNARWQLRVGVDAALGLIALAVLLTFSRGGILALVVAVLTGVGWQALYGLATRWALPVACAGVVLSAALSIHGLDPLTRRLATLSHSSSLAELSRGRDALWASLSRALPAYSRAGAGAGAMRTVYPRYMPDQFDVEFSHGECGYLQLWIETGVPGLALVAAGILLCAWWLMQAAAVASSPRQLAVVGAVLPGLATSAVHSAVDFVWYIPACMSLTLLLLAAGVRASQLIHAEESARDDSLPTPRPTTVLPPGHVRWGVGAVVAGLAVWATLDLLPAARSSRAWDHYLAMSLDLRKYRGASEQLENLEAQQRLLRIMVERDPEFARAQLMLADVTLKLFEQRQARAENPMPLPAVRDAAIQSEFASLTEQDEWLGRALGDNLELLREAERAAQRAVREAPLQGEAYVILAELDFLTRTGSPHRRLWIRQALRLRPYCGSVLLAAGNELALHGKVELAVRYWRAAYERGRELRPLIARMLAPQLPVEQVLEVLRPDREGLASLAEHYHREENREAERVIEQRIAESWESEATREKGAASAPAWHAALTAWRQADQSERAVHCGERALAYSPGNFDLRRDLGEALLGAGRVREAIGQFRWCLSRRPDDEEVRALVERAARRLKSAAKPSEESPASARAIPATGRSAVVSPDSMESLL